MAERRQDDQDATRARSNRQKRGKNRLAAVVYTVLTIALVAFLSYSLYHALGIYIPLLKEQQRYSQLRELASSADGTSSSEDGSAEGNAPASSPAAGNAGVSAQPATPYSSPYAALFAANEDMVGWLKVKDTEIDYPVMKSSEDDPEFYLRRDFDKNYALAGSLFVGGGATVDSDVFIIYGHNVSDESMFGSLDKYKEYDFLSTHSEFTFETPTEQRTYRVFSVFETQIYDESTENDVFAYYRSVGDFHKRDYEAIVQGLRDLSLYSIPAAPEYPDQVLMLSTCSYHTDKGRFVVAAYRVA